MSGTIGVYAALAVAIAFETLGTSFLAKSDEFRKLAPTLVMVGSYACAFYFLSIALRAIPVGVAYAIWSGLGIVLISAIGKIFFKQHLDLAAYVGLGLILMGVVVVNVFSKSVH